MREKYDCRVLIPVVKSGSPKSSKNGACGCSAVSRRDQANLHFRLVAGTMAMLFGLCVLLFTWNIVLWRRLDRLETEVNTLKTTSKETSPPRNDVTHSPSQRSQWMAARSQREKHQFQKRRKLDRERSAEVTMLRSKRSAPKERNFEADLSLEQNLLSRVKRARRRKTELEAARQKKPKKERGRRKERKGRQSLQEATALHIKILGTPPYQGMRSDENGVLRSWNVRQAFNPGGKFDLSEMNSTTGSPGVKVPQSGVYYIYSQITFKMARGVEVHERIKIGVTGAMDLASCVNSMPHNHSSNDYITCSSRGIAYLYKDNKFLVKIQPPSLEIFNNPSYTYFGAFLIGR